LFEGIQGEVIAAWHIYHDSTQELGDRIEQLLYVNIRMCKLIGRAILLDKEQPDA